MELKDLNQSQQQAVTHGQGPMLILAGAGTGKTAVITSRVAWLVENQLAGASEILALTFTDKAANEMQERLDLLLPLGYTELWISTFHSFCERLLKQHALDIGLSNDYRLLNETDQWLLIRNNFDRFDLDYYKPKGNPNKYISGMIKHFSRCKDEMISPENYLKFGENLKLNQDNAFFSENFDDEESKSMEIKRLNEIANAYHTYQTLLNEAVALDFGDLIFYTLELFQKRPNILNSYRKKFKYILVDEFQDTNLAQYELIKLLAAPKNNITVVGDDDQSIYKFRGASVSNILGFLDDYPAAKRVFLTDNYRSKQNILDTAYRFIQNNNPDRLEVKMPESLSKKLIAHRAGEGSVEHLHFKTLSEEVEGVVKKIQELHQIDENSNWNDFAILARGNETLKTFLIKLEEHGIPAIFLGTRGLFTKGTVLDAISFFRLLDNYHENRAMYRVLSLPFWNLNQDDLLQITATSGRKALSLFQVLRQIRILKFREEESYATCEKIVALIEKFTQLAKTKNAREIFISFMNESGYVKYLKDQPDERQKTVFRILNQFDQYIQQFQRRHDEPTIRHLMEEIDMMISSGDSGQMTPDWEEGPEMVKLMTVHGSKGLEFKYVFVVNMVARRFPLDDREDAIVLPDALVKETLPSGDFHLQEERRLFYVACTRAKDMLFFTSADDYGGATKKKISKFLEECGVVSPMVKNQNKEDEKSENEFQPRAERPQAKLGSANAYFPPFAFTKIKSYRTCPLQYYYTHVLKIPVPGNHALSFGTTMHSTMQKFYSAVQQKSLLTQPDLFSQDKTPKKVADLVSFDELLNFYKTSWVDDWYPDAATKRRYDEEAREILKIFYASVKDELPLKQLLETGFRFRLNTHSMTGRFDRIDIAPDGSAEIIDYKTGKPKTAKTLEAEDKMQLLIYQIAYTQIYQTAPSKLTYYFLEDNSRVSFVAKEKDIEKVTQELDETMQKIKAKEFGPTPGRWCKMCSFSSICEFRQER